MGNNRPYFYTTLLLSKYVCIIILCILHNTHVKIQTLRSYFMDDKFEVLGGVRNLFNVTQMAQQKCYSVPITMPLPVQ